MVSAVNTEFDDHNDGRAIDWEDHIGLANLVVKKFVSWNSHLDHYYDDIHRDLWETLWRCTLPGRFDPSAGIRFSTYACVSMLRKYNDICVLYLGYSPRRKYNGKDTVSLNSGGYCEMIRMIAAPTDDASYADDIEYALDMVEAMVGEERMAVITDHFNGGSDRQQASNCRRLARERLYVLHVANPQLAEEIETVLGVKY